MTFNHDTTKMKPNASQRVLYALQLLSGSLVLLTNGCRTAPMKRYPHFSEQKESFKHLHLIMDAYVTKGA